MEPLIEHTKKIFVCPECGNNLLFIGVDSNDSVVDFSGCCPPVVGCGTSWSFLITITERG